MKKENIKNMKEIKFRVFEKSSGKMNEVRELTWHQGKILFYNDSDDYSEPMQYTGLKDKNGKEIYEGDVLKTFTYKPMVVGWSRKFASFVLNRDGWAFSHWFGESCDSEDVEIIGNIHENPELLK